MQAQKLHAMLKPGKIRKNAMPLVRLEKNNGIATVTLNRPDKRNAMSFALLRELVATATKNTKKIKVSDV